MTRRPPNAVANLSNQSHFYQEQQPPRILYPGGLMFASLLIFGMRNLSSDSWTLFFPCLPVEMSGLKVEMGGTW